MAHVHADGSEEFRPRTPCELVAMQNLQAMNMQLTPAEIRMLFGRWVDDRTDRRKDHARAEGYRLGNACDRKKNRRAA